jgi:hypothetical protein
MPSLLGREAAPTKPLFPPYGGFHDGHYSFPFLIPGIKFALFIGGFVPPLFRYSVR